MNALLALTPCVVTASLTALLASRKGRDGFLYFLLSFLWSFGFAFAIVVAAVLGLMGVVLGSLAIGAKSAPLLIAGIGGWVAALLCGVLYLFPLLMVVVLPSRAAPAAAARPASGRRPKARRAR